MKSSIKHISDTRVLVTVTADSAELKSAEQVALVRLGKNIKVAGFRKGRVPIGVVAKHVDPAALSEEIINVTISNGVADVYAQQNLVPLERPQVEVTKFVPGELLEFTAEGDILPEVKLGDHTKLKAKKMHITVEKSDIDDVLTRIKQQFSQKAVVTRKAGLGDEATIDFVGKKAGEAFAGGSGTDYPLVLGSNSFIPGFEQAIVGHATGEEFDIPLTFPKDYSSKELAGQKVEFSVKLKKLQQITEPQETDELAAKIGDFTSMADVRKDIESELTAQKEREATDELRDDLISQLVEKSKVTAPQALIDDQLKSIKQDMLQNLMYGGSTMDQYIQGKGYADLADWEQKEAAPLAIKRVKAGLVLNQLAKVLGIVVTDALLSERIGVYRTQYGNQPDMLKRLEEPEVQRDIANRLATELTVDKLVEANSK